VVSIEILKLRLDLVEPLARMLETIRDAGDEEDFHPHPLTEAALRDIVAAGGQDQYYVMLQNGKAIAYGMLRGWDEGFDVPSLGIAVAPSVRGRGVGLLLIRFLHFAAKEAGASRIRLTVNVDNQAALRLYRGLGYTFKPLDDRLVGHVSL